MRLVVAYAKIVVGVFVAATNAAVGVSSIGNGLNMVMTLGGAVIVALGVAGVIRADRRRS